MAIMGMLVQMANDVFNGVGKETFARGSLYEGDFVAGARQGCGVCHYHNGDYYEGEWAQGLRHGRGMQQCTDDSNYVGSAPSTSVCLFSACWS